MKSLSKSPSLVALSVVVVFILSAFPVSAIDRVSGQFWTYDASMPVAGLNATGTIKYALSGQDSVTASGISYDADILTTNGNLTASSTLFGVPYTVSSVLGGARFQIRGGMSTIREDSLQWTNISIGSAPIQLLARIQKETTTTYTPPFLSKFDSATTRPGDTWTEDITLNTTTILNGTTVQSSSRSAKYTVVVASSIEEVTVEAGTFQTLKITMTDSNGARNMYWWSSKVQNFVVEKRYDPLSTQPTSILSLKEFEASAGAGTLIAVIVGAVVVAVSIVILAAILVARRSMQPVRPLPPPAGQLEPSQVPPPKSPEIKSSSLNEKKRRN